jgi:diadenosine tetraphosphate (Ap4A) HIT family hydrolase
MFKKKVSILLFLVLLLGGCWYWISEPPSIDIFVRGIYCPFCDPSVIKTQAFYEDDLILGIVPNHPVSPGHLLIVSKRHVPFFDQLTDEESEQILRLLKRIREMGKKVPYLLLQKNGMEVGQSVPHVHFHYIPRKVNDWPVFKLIFDLFIASWKKPVSRGELEKTAVLIKTQLNGGHYGDGNNTASRSG